MPLLDLDGKALEYRLIAGPSDRPTLVFLHEGLGSIEAWRDFPRAVAEAAHCPALVYSRFGYGRSAPLDRARMPDYLHIEALEVLPRVLDRLGIEDPMLIGHSDGSSIALIHASQYPVRALMLEAPHVFIEEMTVAGVAEAKLAYQSADLRERLGRYHNDVDHAFWGWNDAWLSPDFRDWNIEDLLPAISCPILLIQGESDEYASIAQLDAIAAGVTVPVESLLLSHCRHAPHRDQAERTRDAMVEFINANL